MTDLQKEQIRPMRLQGFGYMKIGEMLDKWDNTIWTVMVEKTIVHRNGEVTFVFYNGTEIRVEA